MADEVVGPKGLIKRDELVRVIAFTLKSLGFANTADMLEKESGIPLQTELESRFQEQILEGQWDESLDTLSKIRLDDPNLMEMAALGILELKQTESLNTLASVEGTSDSARKNIMKELLKLVSGKDIITEDRLVNLIEEALERQRCWFHTPEDLSLLVDRGCRIDQMPYRTMQVLPDESEDGVILIEFSHNGKYLASASCGCHIKIWEVKDVFELKHRLYTPTTSDRCVRAAPSCMSWSPDDEQLLTCHSNRVFRWVVAEGRSMAVYGKPETGFTSCVWAVDGKGIFAGIAGKKRIYMWDLDGKIIASWKGVRNIEMTPDLGISVDGQTLITVSYENTILFFGWAVKPPVEKNLEEKKAINSFALSNDGRYLLVNLFDQRMHLWSIDDPTQLMVEYKGLSDSDMAARPCFGGVNEALIGCGDAEGKVLIWNRDSGQLITTLNGHSEAVNSVTWNPTHPNMLASASYDRTIRIWDLGCNGKHN